jgi:hypothetical protein
MNNANASWAHYNGIHEIELLNNPSAEFLSFDQVQQCLGWLSGAVPVEHNMCPKSSMAYTGPFNELEICPCCSMTCYYPTKPWKHFTTLSIGPVIHSLYSSQDAANKAAEHMHYIERQLVAIAEHA